MPEITLVIDIPAALPFTVRLVGAFVAPPSVINSPSFPAQIQPPLILFFDRRDIDNVSFEN